MTPWIARNALWLWGLWLLLAMFAGDLAWRRNHRLRLAALAAGRRPVVLRLRTGLLLLCGLALLFGLIAYAVAGQPAGALPGFDMALAAELHARLPASALRVVALITHLGDPPAVTAAALLVVALLLLARRYALAASWAWAMVGIMPINGGIKACFQRPRPLGGHGFITEPGWSFPSGHATGAAVFYGMLAYVLLRLLPPRWHRLVIAAAVCLIGVIGLSRVMLQVHYFSDVMAGYACGLAWLTLCIGLAETLRSRNAIDGAPGAGQQPVVETIGKNASP